MRLQRGRARVSAERAQLSARATRSSSLQRGRARVSAESPSRLEDGINQTGFNGAALV